MDFFSTGLSEASNSLINNEKLISKVYFPRLIVPIATVVVAFVDFLISFCILLALMGWYRFLPDWRIMVLPLFALWAFFASVGPALWITSLNVKYRDFRYVIPFIVQFGLYVSPVGFSSSVVPEQWRWLYSLNPIVGVIDGFRWCILRRAKRAVPARSAGEFCRHCFLPVVGSASVPKDGKKLRGPDLSANLEQPRKTLSLSKVCSNAMSGSSQYGKYKCVAPGDAAGSRSHGVSRRAAGCASWEPSTPRRCQRI